MGKYCYVAVCSAALGASAPPEGGEGRRHIVAAARLQLAKMELHRVMYEYDCVTILMMTVMLRHRLLGASLLKDL